MNWYTGNKMFIPGNFKEYMTEKKQIIKVISEKVLFIVILKGCILELSRTSILIACQLSGVFRSLEETNTADEDDGAVYTIQ
jgi:hypothetical protein